MLCFPFYDLSALTVSFGFSWHCLASVGKKVKEIMRKKCFSVQQKWMLVLTRTLNQLLDSSRVSSAVVNMTVV